MDVVLADIAANQQRITSYLTQCASEGVSIAVFPECALSGYCFANLDEARGAAQPIPGPATEHFAAVCNKLGAHVVFGMLEVAGDRLFNACVLVGPQGVEASYRKIHLPFLGVDRFVTPGDRPFAVHGVAGLRIGMNVCYDGSFPESARVMALAGADLIVLPTNWPQGARCTAQHVVHTRALENCVYYMSVNRVGTERGFSFIGQSRICDPSGNVVAEATHANEATLHATIDPNRARNKHFVNIPGEYEIDRMRDRRPEMYGALIQSEEKTSGIDAEDI
jgi:predicted amidohydrolase